jgi:CRP-like cAMP-binding protein
METLSDIVASHPFTEGLDKRYLDLLVECATCERFGVRQPIFQESFEADRFYLIHTGHVALQVFVPGGGLTTIQTVGAGEALGWSWLYPPYRWHFGATAIEPTEAVVLDARRLREEMRENHDIGYAIAMRVGQLTLERLQATRMRLLELYDVPE